MDDLISRRAAIDAIEDCAEFIKDIHQMVTLIDADMAKTKVRAIPSAQQWIPVEKETPILRNIVLVCDSLGKILFDSYIDGVWVYCPYVVAWMPLPEPYKEEK